MKHGLLAPSLSRPNELAVTLDATGTGAIVRSSSFSGETREEDGDWAAVIDGKGLAAELTHPSGTAARKGSVAQSQRPNGVGRN